MEQLQEVPEPIGLVIRRSRESQSMSQAKLARVLETDVGTVADWENARHDPSWSMVLRLSAVFGWELPWLTGRNGKKEAKRAFLHGYSQAPPFPLAS